MFDKKYLLYFSWAVATVALLGSLYFSEVLGLVPCTLCWYQRIAMYPLVLLLGLAIFKKQLQLIESALILSLFGLAVAFYQNWIYYFSGPANFLFCTNSSCGLQQLNWLGFIDIPQLSLIGFVVIAVSLIFFRKAN